MKKVSVVIPAYNAHNTLARCLGSLVNQTLEDIEIIVVNDASTDDTWEIMKRCEAQFPDKVVIINSDINTGCGGARSIGLDAATGEYIGMADADDYVAPTMYEKLYNRAKETGADIVDSGFYSEATDKALLTVSDDLEGELDDNKRSRLIAANGYLVTKIFKNEILNDPPVRMQQNMAALEDLEIFIYTFLKAKSIASVKEVFYNYCDTAGSNTKMSDLDKYYDAVYRALEGVYDKCHDMEAYEGCQEAIEYILTKVYSYGINRCLYDRIAQIGSDETKVKKYFDYAGEKETKMLNKLSKLKDKVIIIPYENNLYVKNNISKLDIEIMKECDRRN
ncbi:Glycosyl transferase family 2 [Butyrivibrio sp. INlla18]|uniref:glycosyltransferase family 2 protein n=1 Tax=Butyrivibrio sp. INlla18 TaxID=1520806 RepID=UPI00088E9D29|nr:glycosyltransferase family 2 protein [Butyrivibrio sp. INlla18]SDA41840.1 Glycosyl transferase family 2 [Butyrivibrio sp. INlla18]